ncbi:MAG: efflux RND transporter periplasmic adaptor subunit [Bacteroidota bacterium]
MSLDDHAWVASRRGLRIAGMVGSAIAALIVVMGIATREAGNAELRNWTEMQAVPTVAVVLPDSRAASATLDLPGRLEAYYQAPIFARTSGYLNDWKVDIGARVKAGELLAEIDAPDLDQQLLQAQADLASAEANVRLSEATLKRGQTLIMTNDVSRQDLDQRIADVGNKQGLVKSAQAHVRRLQVLEEYKRIVAPFDGLITARNTDVGALINSGAGTGAALFVVADVHKLRIYVNVPQNYVPRIKIGSKAQISVPEYPGRTFSAVVEASSQAVDVASGTTRMQLAVDNASGELMPGAYANVRLELPREGDAWNIPASALIFDEHGLRVATVDADNRVVFKPVVIGRDMGKVIEIASGPTADDRIIDAPPDGLIQGDQVRIASTGDSGTATAASDGPKKTLVDTPVTKARNEQRRGKAAL